MGDCWAFSQSKGRCIHLGGCTCSSPYRCGCNTSVLYGGVLAAVQRGKTGPAEFILLLNICTTIAGQTCGLQTLFSRESAVEFLLTPLCIGEISGTRPKQETFLPDIPPAHIYKALLMKSHSCIQPSNFTSACTSLKIKQTKKKKQTQKQTKKTPQFIRKMKFWLSNVLFSARKVTPHRYIAAHCLFSLYFVSCILTWHMGTMQCCWVFHADLSPSRHRESPELSASPHIQVS